MLIRFVAALLVAFVTGCVFDHGGLSPSSRRDARIDTEADLAVTEDSLATDTLATDTLATDTPVADAPVADTLSPCGTASPTCWDVSAAFSKTDVEYPKYPEYSPQIFNMAVADGKTVYALLDGTSDDTYAEPLFTPSGQCASWEPQPFNTPRTWDIERKLIGPGKYRILVRGSGDADCNYGPIQPDCSGEVEINLNRGWKIINEISCSVTTDTVDSNGVLIPTYCKVDQAGGKISWRSGSSCGGCCACPRGASVNIEVVVSG